MLRRFAPFARAALLVALVVPTSACIRDADTVLEPDPVADTGPEADAEAVLEPAVLIEPARVALDAQGSVAVLTVRSVGDAPLRIQRISRRGDPGFAAVHAGRNALLLGGVELSGEAGLAPGAAVEITVEALVGPPATATLVVETDDPQQPVIEVPVGFPDAPCLMARPMALDFGDVALGEAVGRSVRVSNCGDVPIDVQRIALLDDSDAQFALGAAALPDGPAIEPGAAFDVPVQYTARVEVPARGTLSIDADGVSVQVPLTARGVGLQCPVAQVAEAEFRVQPLDIVQLDGSRSVDGDGPDGRPIAWRWVVVERPDGSVSQVYESFHDPLRPADGGAFDDPATPIGFFFVDLAGDYIFELEVEDAHGCVDRTRVVVQVCPCAGDGITVQLDWQLADNALPDAAVDLDLHLLHPNAESWFSRPFDCHYAEPNPDWGQLGFVGDDPRLDVDALDGGPERIILQLPEDTDALGAPYLVGVDTLAARVDGGPLAPRIDATLRVFVDGVPMFEAVRALRDEQFWDAAQIHWPEGRIEPRDRIFEGRP